MEKYHITDCFECGSCSFNCPARMPLTHAFKTAKIMFMTKAAKEKAKQEAPLIKEAHEMLVKWEQNDPEIRSLWKMMNEWVYAGFDETYERMGVSFDKIYY
jgi:arginyl-tRNA synthetase